MLVIRIAGSVIIITNEITLDKICFFSNSDEDSEICFIKIDGKPKFNIVEIIVATETIKE